MYVRNVFRNFIRYSHHCLWLNCLIDAITKSPTDQERISKVRACQDEWQFNETDSGYGKKRLKYLVDEEVPSFILGVWLLQHRAPYCSGSVIAIFLKS